jgi:peptidoglycan/xylan/chitin deacetylase (PgdA/CDA1 family)
LKGENLEILVVTYHFLAGDLFPGKGVHPFGPERFKAQVERLARNTRFLSVGDLVGEVLPPLGAARRYALLTFDDGLAEQAEIAWPILEAKGIPAVFFPCTAPLETGRLLHVHRMHALRSAMEDRELLALFAELAKTRGFGETARRIEKSEGLLALYPYDSPEARRVKSLFNYDLPVQERETLAELAFSQVFGEEGPWAERLYMTADTVRKLGRAGCLGSHTHTHKPLASLEVEDVRREIAQSLDILERIAGTRPASVSYPYGNRLAVSAEVFAAASACGLRVGFTTERRLNFPGTDRLALARFDAEDLPPGKRPLFNP